MNDKMKWLSGVFAIGLVTTAGALDVKAATWSDVIGRGESDHWTDGGMAADLEATRRVTTFSAHGVSTNYFSGGMFVECRNRPLAGFGGKTYRGSVTIKYRCPFLSPVNAAQGWLADL